MKVNVAIIHGIGKSEPGYALQLIDGIQRQFQRYIREISKIPINTKDELSFQEIVWDDILGENQEKLKKIFEKEFQRRKKMANKGALRRCAKFAAFTAVFFLLVNPWYWRMIFIALALAFGFGKKILIPLRTGFAAEYINDIIGYRNKEAYQRISRRIEECIARLHAGPDKEPVTFISHSLGTVISSDFVYDRQKQRAGFHQNLALWNFFTLGSPLALFSLQFGPELFKSPIKLEDIQGRWVNILDTDDVIAYPLKTLNEAYASVVHSDVYVESGILGVAHIRYWNNKQAHEIIGRKLALDWLTVNQRHPAAELTRMYANYDSRYDSQAPLP